MNRDGYSSAKALSEAHNVAKRSMRSAGGVDFVLSTLSVERGSYPVFLVVI